MSNYEKFMRNHKSRQSQFDKETDMLEKVMKQNLKNAIEFNKMNKKLDSMLDDLLKEI